MVVKMISHRPAFRQFLASASSLMSFLSCWVPPLISILGELGEK